MTMTPRFNKFALTAHITFSVGWVGAVVAYLALAIAGLTVHDTPMVRAAYLSMELIGWFVIVPFSFAALLTGLVQSLSTQWGLFRHYWILAKFLLTTGAAQRLTMAHAGSEPHVGPSGRDDIVQCRFPRAADSTRGSRCGRPAGVARGHDAVGVQAVGHDPDGGRKQHERRKVSQADLLSYPALSAGSVRESTTSAPRWAYVVGFHAIGLALLFVVLHLTVGLRSH